MTALELIGVVNQVLFVGLFGVVLLRALRRPTRAAIDTALLFGGIAAVVILTRVVGFLGVTADRWVVAVELLMLNAAPFAMLRLVDDFRGTPRWVQVAGSAAFVLVGALGFIFTPALEIVSVASIALFLAVGGYAAVAFTTESSRTSGMTRNRMMAVAAGAFLFIGAVVTVFAGAIAARFQPATSFIGQVLALAAVVSFFLGFAPPTWIRRAWREPDLRRFLERSLHLTGLADERQALLELEEAAASAFGATGAAVGIADVAGTTLRYPGVDGWQEHPSDAFVAGRAFTEQRRVAVQNAAVDDPTHAAAYESSGARTVIAAPISTEHRRIGVLAVYASRAPLFVEDDLWLLELLADQAAVLLEARTLTSHASELRAREDAARLKEEFLSAAAHDLRTPLTVVLGQAELLERRIARNPNAPVDPAGVARMAKEARRLRDLVSDLLDAQRLEEARAVMELRPTDVREVVTEVASRYADHGVRLPVVLPEEPAISLVDVPRLDQVLDNLIDNALKYGADGQAPEVALEVGGGLARVRVVDRGIGVPEPERQRLFERFFRASNAHSITDTGIGLGLFICRRIVEEHGGTIAFEPTPGGGSTFKIALPLATAAEEPVGPSVLAAPIAPPQVGGALADA